MREPPAGVSTDDVANVVSSGWAVEVERVVHLPVGFGAHHWRVETDRGPLFATLDHVGPRRSVAVLEDAYASAAELRRGGLEGVVPSLTTVAGEACTVPLGAGRLSCAPWVDGVVVGEGPLRSDEQAAATAELLGRLHVAPPPSRLPRWSAKVTASLPADLDLLSREEWSGGPYGDEARSAVLARLAQVETWTADYLRLVDVARTRPWVTTHGEPHTANQLRTSDRVVLVDWESVTLAPHERDLSGLAAYGWSGLGADPEMLAMFDLEWRLDEIEQYATWLAGPHTGSADDSIALEGLLRELER